VEQARAAYSDLVRRATDRPPKADELRAMDAYAMAATVDFGLDAKQGCSTCAPRTRGCAS